jgi:hypothetical protein
MSKNYIVSEERLFELLEAEAKLQCLEQDGVDNWEWYMEGRKRFIAEALCISEGEVEDRNLDFEDLVKIDIQSYEEYEGSSCDRCSFGSMTGM